MLLRLPRRFHQSRAWPWLFPCCGLWSLPFLQALPGSPPHVLLPVSPVAPLPILGRNLTPVQPPPLPCSPPCLLKPWCGELGAGAGQVTAASGQALLNDTGSSDFLICSK